ncbi:MAG: 30S ribosomal protein S7 [bacterium JZ-2024 1]
MGRRGKAEKRIIPPDGKYHSVLVQRLINKVMKDGKKSVAEWIVYGALERVGEKTKKNPLEVLEQAIHNVTPLLQVRSRRVGGANYQVPVEVPPEKGLSLALRWLVEASRARKGRNMIEKLSAEILDAQKNEGGAVRKKQEVHRMAEANRAFAHYRW